MALVSSIASAQATPRQADATLSKAQVKLYEDAFEAYGKKNFHYAIELLKAALEQGSVNILHLSLGRTLFRAGDCKAAARRLTLALRTPTVSKPSIAEVAARVAKYRVDLKRSCPGTLRVRCQPPAMKISIDEKTQHACSEETFLLPPGRHRIVGQHETMVIEKTFDVISMQQTRLLLRAQEPAAPIKPALPSERSRALSITGWGLLGGGVTALATTTIIDAAALGNAIDRFRQAAATGDPRALERQQAAKDLQAITIAAYLVGGVLAIAGSSGLIYDTFGVHDRSSPTAWLSTDGAGAGYWARF